MRNRTSHESMSTMRVAAFPETDPNCFQLDSSSQYINCTQPRNEWRKVDKQKEEQTIPCVQSLEMEFRMFGGYTACVLLSI